MWYTSSCRVACLPAYPMLTCAACWGLLSICSEPERRDEADEREASTDTAERIRQEQEARRRMIERKLQRKCLCFCIPRGAVLCCIPRRACRLLMAYYPCRCTYAERTRYCVVRSKPESGVLRTLMFANDPKCGAHLGPAKDEFESYLTFWAFREPLPSTQAFCVSDAPSPSSACQLAEVYSTLIT